VRKLALATIALAGLGSAFAIPAHAAVDDAGPGVICEFFSTTDPTAQPGTQTGELSGGPLVLQDSTTLLPGSGTLTCRIQVTVSNHTGTGPAVSGHGNGVVNTGASEISYTAADTDNVYLCGEFTDDSDGTTYYWDDTHSVWVANNPLVDCGLAISAGGSDDPVLGPVFDTLNATVCPVLLAIDSRLNTPLAQTWGDCENSVPII
jgi:hypothetical protein